MKPFSAFAAFAVLLCLCPGIAPAQERGLALPGGAPAATPSVAAEEAARAASDRAFRRGLDAAARGRWDAALSAARELGDAERDVILWFWLRAGQGDLLDYTAFAARHPDWPGMSLLRRKAEAKLAGEPAAQVSVWFGTEAPMTPPGALALIRAAEALYQPLRASRVAREAWLSFSLSPAEQDGLLAAEGQRFAPLAAARMIAMLNAGETAQAGQMLPLVTPDFQALAAARIALQNRSSGVNALVRAVPEDLQDDPGLVYDRARWRWRAGLEQGAAELVLAQSAPERSLGDPARWAGLRSALAREFLRDGDPGPAYSLAAGHRMSPKGGAWADLEWLAGYAALKEGKADLALTHFDALAAGVGTPISASRAAYWQGQALAAAGEADRAREAWQRGAGWQTAFYGLLSAEKAEEPLDPRLVDPAPLPAWKGAPFTKTSLGRAAAALHRVGAEALARRFVLQIEEVSPPALTPKLAAMAADWDDSKLTLVLAKRAAAAGVVLPGAYFPFPAIRTDGLGVPEELALSIARRESEFDPEVVSPAGARGLMQLMPGTAQLMAGVLGEEYDLRRLTGDPGYNLRLGSAYLARLRQEFGTSPVLVAAGYNAGPARARSWIAKNGDPRDPSVDIVDWIEAIPYNETRDYVMRVSESLPVYRARLGRAEAGPLDFTGELRGEPPVPLAPERSVSPTPKP